MPKAKKQSKLKRTLNWLKPNTRLKQLVVFALVIAIAGGGYSVYKSHADSWTVTARQFYTKPGTAAYISRDCNGDKGCVDVMKLPRGVYSNVGAKIYIPSGGHPVYLCAIWRAELNGTNPYGTLTWLPYVDDTSHRLTATPASNSLNKSTSYQTTCTLIGLPAGSHQLYAEIFNDSPDGGPMIDVVSITMKW